MKCSSTMSERQGTILYTIDTNESLPTGQLLALPYHTQRGPTHEVMILVLQRGHS